jgi:hypothetical protein
MLANRAEAAQSFGRLSAQVSTWRHLVFCGTFRQEQIRHEHPLRSGPVQTALDIDLEVQPWNVTEHGRRFAAVEADSDLRQR